jgi:hypothetical protein
MARNLSSSIDNAIDNETSYRLLMRATVYPSYIYIDSIDNNNPLTGADPVGVLDDPVLQDISINPTSGSLITWWNDSQTLKYIRQGDNTNVTTSYAGQRGKPGPYGNYVYRATSSQVIRSTVDWSDVDSELADPFSSNSVLGSHGGTPVACHGVSNTRCVTILDDDGGLRVQIWDNTTVYNQPGRFMSPKAVDYTSTSGSERSALSIATFSGAVEFGGKVYVYISNPATGAVEGISWDTSSKVWSDIFTAVSTDIQSSLCEFRVSNAYARNGTSYLIGQFRRTENVGTDYAYTMVLSSQSGRTYSLDGFTLVSQLGYRFLATVGEGRLFIGSCNRVSSDLLTYVFDGTSGSDGLYMDIPMTDIITFRESNVTQNELRLRAGDDYYAYHQYLVEGSKIVFELGYATSAGDEYTDYATYIIDSLANSTEQGKRLFGINLIQFSEWKLTGLSSPYYNEFFAKSSVYDDCSEDSGNLYIAPNVYDYRDLLSVDFWDHYEYDNSGSGITGEKILWNGGVTHLDDSGAHKHGIRTRDFMEILDIAEYPMVTDTAPHAKAYGWSHANSGTTNDIIELILFVKHEDGTDETIITNEDMRWPNYYPTYDAQDGYPLDFDLSGYLVEGDKLQAIGYAIEGNNTDVCPARVDLTGGWDIRYNYGDNNTPWTRDIDKLKLPNPLRPYVMFSQKPYNAWNSFQVAQFKIDVGTGITGYSVGAGLVCLAMDGGSYILGRYEDVDNKWEIVKVRQGQETILASQTPSGTVQDTFTIGFSHRDGTFTIWWETGGTLVEELSYDWTATDGWIYESDTISMKCGIWGIIDAPWFETTGISYSSKPNALPGGSEGISATSDGIPYMPGYNVSNFPSSGRVKIGKNIYSYTSKVDIDPVLGPHQLRQHGYYPEPFGDEMYGMEFLFFQWNRSDSEDVGRIAALDNGCNYVISHSDYTVKNSTGGVTANLHHRCRAYSDNENIAKSSKYLSNRVWITGGLKGVEAVEGNSVRHRMGDKVGYHIEGDIWCNWYKASSGMEELTIRDLISKVSEYSGASAEFPGDVTVASVTPGGQYKVGTQEYVEGIDLSFEIPDLSSGKYVEVLVDCVIENSSGSQAGVRITNTGTNTYEAELYVVPSTTIETYEFGLTADELHVRTVFHDNFITLDIGGSWVYTFAVDTIAYLSSCDIYVNSDDSPTYTNILLGELSDWREAIYIDLETDGKAALSSVIQERPVETCHETNGSISYWYDRTRDRVTQVVEPRKHTRRRKFPRGSSSDGIIYYSDVAAIQNTDYAARYGFSTKVYRFPSLTVGAIRAARIIMQRNLESAISHQLELRPDARLEVGDVLDVDFTASGTQKQINPGVIVESVLLMYDPNSGNSIMNVSGREEL